MFCITTEHKSNCDTSFSYIAHILPTSYFETFMFICIQNMNFIPNFFLYVNTDIGNLLPWVLWHSVHPRFCWGGLNLSPNFQKGGLDRTSTLRGGCWKRGGVTFFRGGLQFLHKKLKSEIFNNKKVYKQKYFFLS